MTRKVITSNLSALSKKHQQAAKRLPIAVGKAQKQIADEAIALYDKTVRTWMRKKPRFYARKTVRGFMIVTDDPIYDLVDHGTKPHIIRAKNAPMLVFRWPYRAATKPRVIGSINAQYGANWARKFMVHHPGTKPRHFTDEITKRMQKRAANIMRKQIRDAINVEAVGL